MHETSLFTFVSFLLFLPDDLARALFQRGSGAARSASNSFTNQKALSWFWPRVGLLPRRGNTRLSAHAVN